MRIDIERKGTHVAVKVTVHIPFYEPRVWTFEWNAASEAYAGLLAEHFRKGFNDRVRAIREEAYTKGWEDHKKRRPKDTWFSGCINE